MRLKHYQSALLSMMLWAAGCSGRGSLLVTRYGSFDPAAESMPDVSQEARLPADPFLKASDRSLALSPGAASHWILQCSDPIRPAWREAIQGLGVQIRGYVPNHAFWISATPLQVRQLRSWPFVRAVVVQPALMRLGPSLVVPTRQGFRLASETQPKGVVLEIEAKAKANVRQAVAQAGGEILEEASPLAESDRLLRARLDPAALRGLVERNDVLSIEAWQSKKLYNDIEYGMVQAGPSHLHTSPLWNQGLRGQDQILGICDGGLNTHSCRVSGDKIAGYDHVSGQTPDIHNFKHGTHVVGTAVGDNLANGLYDFQDGMAPAARLYFQEVGTQDGGLDVPTDVSQLFDLPYQAGVRIHSNSWGADSPSCAPSAEYNADARAVDAFMWDHPDFLAVFAAGNCGPHPETVGSPGTAKNAVTVGSHAMAPPSPDLKERGITADTFEDISDFSSQGPTFDGRIKPTVVAPGQDVLSANFHTRCGVISDSGTSMATPVVAGAAVMIRQYLTEGFYPTGTAEPKHSMQPSAALIKALLIAGAQPMKGQLTVAPPPSTGQGFGRIQLNKVLYFKDDTEQLWIKDATQGITEGRIDETLQVYPGGRLKVVLVWTDPPGSINAAVTLVNDLDLVVVGPQSTYQGNAVINGHALHSGDRLNVEEEVDLPHAAPGVYTLSVQAYNVPLGPQPYALVAVGRFQEAPLESSHPSPPDHGHPEIPLVPTQPSGEPSGEPSGSAHPDHPGDTSPHGNPSRKPATPEQTHTHAAPEASNQARSTTAGCAGAPHPAWMLEAGWVGARGRRSFKNKKKKDAESLLKKTHDLHQLSA